MECFGCLEGEKLTKQKRKQYCGTLCTILRHTKDSFNFKFSYNPRKLNEYNLNFFNMSLALLPYLLQLHQKSFEMRTLK